jgi:hypothetical protein
MFLEIDRHGSRPDPPRLTSKGKPVAKARQGSEPLKGSLLRLSGEAAVLLWSQADHPPKRSSEMRVVAVTDRARHVVRRRAGLP